MAEIEREERSPLKTQGSTHQFQVVSSEKVLQHTFVSGPSFIVSDGTDRMSFALCS